jgi:spore coat polysaccharide biosynthesis protein SpsF
MKVLAIIQARMTSSRLPGKVLRPILGEPMMGRQIERLRRSRRLDELVVATSTDASDDVIVDYCATLGVRTHRGSLQDVLGRYAGALEALGPADHVVRLTADCPLADWGVIDDCVALHLETGADYTSNAVDRWFPRGLDVEVFKAPLLPMIAAEAADPYEREHVTPFFYRHPERFDLKQLTQPAYEGNLRWTVDTPEDFAFTTQVYEALYSSNPAFGSGDIRALAFGRRIDPNEPAEPRR